MASDRSTPSERDEFDVDVVPGQRRGAHRTQSPPALVAVLAASVALVVLALIVTVVAMTGMGTPDPEDVVVAPSPPRELPLQTAEPIQPEIDKGSSLTVLNGTRVRNLSTRVKGELENDGWIVNRTGNNEDRSLSATVVQYSDPELAQTAQALVDLLDGGTIQRVPEDDLRASEDLLVLLGRSYAVAHNLATSGTSTTTGRDSTGTRSAPADGEDGTSTSTRTGDATATGTRSSSPTRR